MNRILYYVEIDKESIAFHCSTNLKQPALMQRVWPLIIGTWQDFFFIYIKHTPRYVSSDEEGLERAAGKTG